MAFDEVSGVVLMSARQRKNSEEPVRDLFQNAALKTHSVAGWNHAGSNLACKGGLNLSQRESGDKNRRGRTQHQFLDDGSGSNGRRTPFS